MRRPLGCLTFSALFVVILVLGGVAAVAVITANGIFSPGPLSAATHGAPVGGVASHAALAGRCDACHTAFWSGERMADRCLACHTPVAQEMTSGSGLHGRFVTGSACRECHTDHHGATASLTLAGFTIDHDRTRYPLVGKHVGVGCGSCHVGGQWTGIGLTCATCHAKDNPHGTRFPGDCATCHSPAGWTDATFDHDKSAFPLTGAHSAVSCQSCHAGGVFKGTPTTCSACHPAPSSHTAAFGSDCASCHSTTAWTPAKFTGPHLFPLNHGGAGGTCATCHPTTFAAYSCASCHAPASMAARHSGISGYSTDCVRCHPTGSGN